MRLCDHHPPEAPWPPFDEYVPDVHGAATPGDDGAAIPGLPGWQFCRGISA